MSENIKKATNSKAIQLLIKKKIEGDFSKSLKECYVVVAAVTNTNAFNNPELFLNKSNNRTAGIADVWKSIKETAKKAFGFIRDKASEIMDAFKSLFTKTNEDLDEIESKISEL